MRKPRDIDAELRALAERTKGLKARKVTQLGELAMGTGADALEPEILAGVLLAAVETRDATLIADWRGRGERFFRAGGSGGSPSRKPPRAAEGEPGSGAQGTGGAAPG